MKLEVSMATTTRRQLTNAVKSLSESSKMVKANYFPFDQSIFGIMHPPVYSFTEDVPRRGRCLHQQTRIPEHSVSQAIARQLSVEGCNRLHHLGLLLGRQLGINGNRDSFLGRPLRFREVSFPVT